MAHLDPNGGRNGGSRRRYSRDSYLFLLLWIFTLIMVAIIVVPVTMRMRSNPQPLRTSERADEPLVTPVQSPAPEPIEPGKLDIRVYLRVELVSVIFRLAGNPEYNQAGVDSYARDVEAHFGAFRSHEAVRYARALRNTKGISFDAPMNLAVHLGDLTSLKPRVPFDPRPATLDGRWSPKEASRFAELAAAFAKDSEFDAFAQDHQTIYDETATRLERTISDRANLAWFSAFYGIPQGARFTVIPTLLNGGNSYGASFHEGEAEELYCLLGVSATDEQGLPQFGDDVLPIVVHEFCHSYANPFVDAHEAALRPAGEDLFAKSEREMRRNAFGDWRKVLTESIVRASIVCYLQAYGDSEAANLALEKDRETGFQWLPELVGLFRRYDTNRGTYPDLESFLPEIIGFFEGYTTRDPA